MADDDVSVKLKTLAKEYNKQLINKAREVESSWDTYKKSGDKDQITILIRMVHTMSGTAGTYGYQLISEITQQIENKLKIIANNAADESDFAVINSLINDLNQIVIAMPEKYIAPMFEVDTLLQKKVSTIYILEANQQLRLQLADEISQFNYLTKSFASTELFLEAISLENPDLVIVSIDCAEDIVPEIFANLREALVLIIFTAELDTLANRLFTVRHGGQAFLPKPFDYQLLMQTMDILFEARKMNNQRIMIVDDSAFLAEYYQVLLEHAGLITEMITEPRNFLSRLQEFQPDLILMDINMPYCSGTELAQIAHQNPAFSGIPIIFLSSISERSKQMEVLSLAGDDFLVKPVKPSYLISSVRNRLLRSHILRFRMMRDSLTNLYNHTMILHQLEREMLIAKRYGHDLSIVLYDIDHFKLINDTYGHQAGDRILKELSTYLTRYFRQSDIIGRYGGEEFLVIMPNTDARAAQSIVDDFRIQFAKIPHSVGANEVYITLSGGIASFKSAQNINDLVRLADVALYNAKEGGRNQVVVSE